MTVNYIISIDPDLRRTSKVFPGIYRRHFLPVGQVCSFSFSWSFFWPGPTPGSGQGTAHQSSVLHSTTGEQEPILQPALIPIVRRLQGLFTRLK